MTVCWQWNGTANSKRVPSPRRFRPERSPKYGTRELRKPRKRLPSRSESEQMLCERIRDTQALAVAYDRDATCYENRLRKKWVRDCSPGGGRNTFGVAASVATRAFLRANLWSMKEREVDGGGGRGEGKSVGDLFMSWCPSSLLTPESGLARTSSPAISISDTIF